MAKQELDVKKILYASFITIGIGVVLVIISLILELLTFVITDSNSELVSLAYMIFLIILYPVFLGLFLWTGYRAAKSFSFDAVGAGGVSAFSYFVIGIVELVLQTILAAIIVTKPMGVGTFGSPQMALASSLFGGIVGMKGLALSAVCGIGILILGAMINFVLGGFGALFALRKSG